MIKPELTKLKEQALDKPFTPRLSEIVDRIDRFLDEEALYESDAPN